MSEKIKELKESFDSHAKFASELTLELINAADILGKNQIKRVFLAAMEYPVKPTRALVSEEEVQVAKLAIALKEQQMSMGMLNLAMADLDRQAEALEEKEDDKSV